MPNTIETPPTFIYTTSPALSLRDRFALVALKGELDYISQQGTHYTPQQWEEAQEVLVKNVWELADKMMKARGGSDV